MARTDSSEGPEPASGEITGPSSPQSQAAPGEARAATAPAGGAGRKRAATKRPRKMAARFSPEDLEVFEQMEVGAEIQERIAKIRHAARRRQVIERIALGTEPEEALRDVEAEEARAVAEEARAVAELSRLRAAPSPEDEKSDREWLDFYCDEKRAMVADAAKYDADAALYRRVRDALHDLKTKAKRGIADAKRAAGNGPFFWALYRLCYLSHPKHWLLCEVCRARGVDGSGRRCGRCSGAGYVLKTEVPWGAPRWERHSERS